MIGRLPAGVEASALVRRVNSDGGFATVLAKGDEDRGSLLLIILQKSDFFAIFERLLDMDGQYRWTRTGPSNGPESPEIREFLAKRRQRDPDQWQIELDVADAERFVAETIEIS
ncbi:DUF1491 family protein [Sphingomicrobium sediminis]|uniref:DUF1491 family protein n=1 Tax=Sphingomicrobium sediminis TaxID=2950949 RepID=A0A9X2EJR3_9SPHN|nr:DUF1491 family protein [Sphingomicrobium sediminis]MCM8558091.1 DUF1491 family protein [Sphingomicrobium sediminis]